MDQNKLPDSLIGDNLPAALQNALAMLRTGDPPYVVLILNADSGGFIPLPEGYSATLRLTDSHRSFIPVAMLRPEDIIITERILDDPFALASLADFILHNLENSLSQDIPTLTIQALSLAFKSATEYIDSLPKPVIQQEETMALKGPLPKVLNYMGIMFAQGGYEFLNIAFNMAAKEYELLTAAEIEKMRSLSKWGDRRLVLTCTVHELKHLLPSPQITLEIPSVEKDHPKTSQDRQLDPRLNSERIPRSDGPDAGRSRDDGSNAGDEPNHLEPPELPHGPGEIF